MPAYLRLLVLGPPKVGKTLTCIPSCPEGGVYVINSDQPGSADHARKARDFTESALCEHPQVFSTAYQEIKRGIKDGKIQTVVWDTVSEYGRKVAYLYEDEEKDGRKAWGRFARNVSQCVDSLVRLECHVVVLGHSVIEEAGLALDISGQSGRRVPSAFNEVWLLEKKGDKRVLSKKRGGVLGSRGLPPGVDELEADISALWGKIQASNGS